MIYRKVTGSVGTVVTRNEVITRWAMFFAAWSLILTYIVSNGSSQASAEVSNHWAGVEQDSTWWFKMPDAPELDVLKDLDLRLIDQLKSESEVISGTWQPAVKVITETRPEKVVSIDMPEFTGSPEPQLVVPSPAIYVDTPVKAVFAERKEKAISSPAPISSSGAKDAARMLISSRQYGAALNLLLENLPDITQDEEHYGLLAVVMLGNHQYQEAVDTYASLVQLKPKNPQWWAGYALSLEKLGHLKSVTLAYQALFQITARDSRLGMLARQKLTYYASA